MKGRAGRDGRTDLEDVDEAVEVHEHERHVGVALRHAQEIEVVVLDVHEGAALLREDRPLFRLLLLLHVEREPVGSMSRVLWTAWVGLGWRERSSRRHAPVRPLSPQCSAVQCSAHRSATVMGMSPR